MNAAIKHEKFGVELTGHMKKLWKSRSTQRDLGKLIQEVERINKDINLQGWCSTEIIDAWLGLPPGVTDYLSQYHKKPHSMSVPFTSLYADMLYLLWKDEPSKPCKVENCAVCLHRLIVANRPASEVIQELLTDWEDCGKNLDNYAPGLFGKITIKEIREKPDPKKIQPPDPASTDSQLSEVGGTTRASLASPVETNSRQSARAVEPSSSMFLTFAAVMSTLNTLKPWGGFGYRMPVWSTGSTAARTEFDSMEQNFKDQDGNASFQREGRDPKSKHPSTTQTDRKSGGDESKIEDSRLRPTRPGEGDGEVSPGALLSQDKTAKYELGGVNSSSAPISGERSASHSQYEQPYLDIEAPKNQALDNSPQNSASTWTASPTKTAPTSHTNAGTDTVSEETQPLTDTSQYSITGDLSNSTVQIQQDDTKRCDPALPKQEVFKGSGNRSKRRLPFNSYFSKRSTPGRKIGQDDGDPKNNTGINRSPDDDFAAVMAARHLVSLTMKSKKPASTTPPVTTNESMVEKDEREDPENAPSNDTESDESSNPIDAQQGDKYDSNPAAESLTPRQTSVSGSSPASRPPSAFTSHRESLHLPPDDPGIDDLECHSLAIYMKLRGIVEIQPWGEGSHWGDDGEEVHGTKKEEASNACFTTDSHLSS